MKKTTNWALTYEMLKVLLRGHFERLGRASRALDGKPASRTVAEGPNRYLSVARGIFPLRMGNPDAIFHDLANQDPTGIARLVLGEQVVAALGLPASVPIVRRRDADAVFLFRRADGSEAVLHAECELGRRRVAERLLEYAAIFAKREHREARRAGRLERPLISAVLRLRG